MQMLVSQARASTPPPRAAAVRHFSRAARHKQRSSPLWAPAPCKALTGTSRSPLPFLAFVARWCVNAALLCMLTGQLSRQTRLVCARGAGIYSARDVRSHFIYSSSQTSRAASQAECSAAWDEDNIAVPRCLLEWVHRGVDGADVEPSRPQGTAHRKLQLRTGGERPILCIKQGKVHTARVAAQHLKNMSALKGTRNMASRALEADSNVSLPDD